jgi:hypothetical protein
MGQKEKQKKEYPDYGENLWQILADFVADFVAGSTKPLDNQGVLRS